MNKVTVFAGPTTFGLSEKLLKCALYEWRAPIRRGDLSELLKSKTPSVVVICDGVFQIEPAVSHKEICDALDAGWKVWGVSSLGAIRAAEMAHLGMHGFGYVYESFATDPDFCDDEACLLYFPEPPFFPVSEPLVNLRFAFSMFGSNFGIESKNADCVIKRLRGVWFGDRTHDLIAQIIDSECGISEKNREEFLAMLRDNQRKQLDLSELLEARPWE